jgi:thiamine-phosphate pyrophosphorylase
LIKPLARQYSCGPRFLLEGLFFRAPAAGYDLAVGPLSRILDANANRAREAMRVMEDAARFALDDPALSGEFKRMRHDLRAILETLLPPGALEANRDTPGDVGTEISTAPERDRRGLVEIAAAAGKRLGEALRVIEESAKALDPAAASVIQALRYRGYDLEQRLGLRLGSGRARQWRVCVLLTESLCRRPWRDVVGEAVRAGADCIQVREKDMPDRDLLRRVRDVIEMVKISGASVIVNDRPDLALLAGADGVHLGRDDLSIHDVRRLAGRQLLVGASTHDLDEAKAAIDAGADYCGVGAMFASPLKPDRQPSGPRYLQQFIERYPAAPHLAIGGITPDNIPRIVHAGGRGVAVSAAVCAAEEPAAVVQALLESLHVAMPA